MNSPSQRYSTDDDILDIVDENDIVIGQKRRADIHAEKLLHRAVHILVFNTSGELLVHRRSANKDEYPLYWTTSASGHLDAGEEYSTAAGRELQEELGIVAQPEFLHKFPASPQTANEHSAIYRVITDDEPVFDPEEIAEGKYIPLDELVQDLERHPDRYTPPFAKLVKWYMETSFE